MYLSSEQIKKFKSLNKKLLGKEVVLSEVCEQATSLIRIVELTYQPMTKRDFKRVQKRRAELELKK